MERLDLQGFSGVNGAPEPCSLHRTADVLVRSTLAAQDAGNWLKRPRRDGPAAGGDTRGPPAALDRGLQPAQPRPRSRVPAA